MTPLQTVYSKSKTGDMVTRADLMRAETADDLPEWRVCAVSKWGFDLTENSSVPFSIEPCEPASEAEYKAMYALAAKRVAEFNGYAATDARTCPW